jgi:O-succinylbenzoate synthase
VTLRRHELRIGDRPVTLLEGPAGWGERSPLPGYPSDGDASERAATEAACAGWPAPVRTWVPVNALVDGPADVGAGLAAFPCVKVKVGRDDPDDDVRLVEAVRAAVGAAVSVRVDANGAWDVDTALATIARLEPFGLELVEQPVASIDDLAEVRRRAHVPVAADECVRSVDDARRLAALGAADAVVLKVQPLGGVRAALRVADAAGVPAIVTSMRETSVGIAAGLALAAALPELHHACGLAAGMPGGDVVADPLVPEAGLLRVRRVEPDPDLLARYEVVS